VDCAERAIIFNIKIDNAGGINHNFSSLQTLVHLRHFSGLSGSGDRNMDMSTISRKLGTLILFGVPAIIGGGIVYYLFDSYTPVVVYEVLLGITALGFISK